MRNFLFIILLALISLTSCRKDFDTVPSNGRLTFSKDTVYLDTVFTGVASSTYTLKVYNKSNDDITIPSIALGKGANSKYRLMVDGMTGQDDKGQLFNNVELLAKDSLYIFIEETAAITDANPTDFLYTDKILFDTGDNQQDVDLVTLIQDAYFIYPKRTKNPDNSFTYEGLPLSETDPKLTSFPLDENDPVNGNELHFTNSKPYVIYGFPTVPNNKVLEIDAGARVHFHDQSGIIVANAASIQVNGSDSTTEALENEVIFEGDRLEPGFAEIPGQWFSIILTDGSTNNYFKNLTIKNATVGLFIQHNDGTTVEIENTQIYNSSVAGILARTAKINGKNIVINKAGQYALACTYGGSYDFNHCTFANYWSGSRQNPAVLLDNTFNDGQNILTADLVKANFTNSIIYGPNSIEIGLKKSDQAQFNFDISYSLIKFSDYSNQFTGTMYDFVKNPGSKNNLVTNSQTNNDPKFKEAYKNNLRILKNSPVIGKGNATFIISQDIDGINRTSPPDLGAYKHLDE
ncbi:hypothetical protein [Flavobacterium sp. H122]|uniref:hypothetical protein n=1 Tax=Flavobacterium sp. H122 TaxID=2529860 RepID=UPI0010A9D4DD|nr:hypothetical protein [Flavobacterium sp. H122]